MIFPNLAANQALQSDDAFYLFDHFDTYFSVIENASQMQMPQLLRAIDLLYRTTEKLGKMLDSYLNQQSLDRQSEYLNLTKMVMYLLVSTARAIDNSVKDASKSMANLARKNNKRNDDQAPNANWEPKRYDVLIQVYNFMQLPLEKLFPNAIIEEDFTT